MRAPPRSRMILCVCVALAGCTAPPVQWTDDRAIRASGRVTLASDGSVRADSLQLERLPLSLPSCSGSVRVAGAGSSRFAVYWAPRADSSARLMSSRSDDGGTSWRAAVPVDTTDQSASGCARTPPAIAADAATGYVHVAYAMRAREGPGLFFSHSMDRGMTYHSAVPIIYGEHLGYTAIAADGDRVAVAFEDPNSTSPRIGLALSRTMGHIFEERILPVSDDHGAASRPLVSIAGTRIVVAWREGADSAAGITLRVRRGILH